MHEVSRFLVYEGVECAYCLDIQKEKAFWDTNRLHLKYYLLSSNVCSEELVVTMNFWEYVNC